MKKLLITSDCFIPRWDGIARVLAETIPYLAKNYEITVVCPDFGIAPDLPVKYVRFQTSNRQYGDYVPAVVNKKALYSAVKNADLVFNHTMGPIGYRTIKFAKRLKKPVVSYIHSIDWELFSNSIKWGKPLVYGSEAARAGDVQPCKTLMVVMDVANKMIDNKIKTPMAVD